jgi:hypothetical protein
MELVQDELKSCYVVPRTSKPWSLILSNRCVTTGSFFLLRDFAQYSGRYRCFTATSDDAVRLEVLGLATQKLPIHISLYVKEITG